MPPVVDLMSALQKSLAHARKAIPGKSRPAKPRKLRKTEDGETYCDAATVHVDARYPFEEVLSFLKETRGELTWSAKDLADSLKISFGEARHVLSLFELQGYVKRSSDKSQWITTLNGESVSNSTQRHFTIVRVKAALGKLEERIKELNSDRKASG